MKVFLKKFGIDKVFLIGILLFSFIFVFNFLNRNSESTVSNTLNPIEQVYASLPESAQHFYYQQSESLTKPVPERLVELDQLTIGCFGSEAIMQMSESDENLGGQCCGVLKDIEAYELQLSTLEEFISSHGNLDVIPKDPYDVSVATAQKLINYDQNIILNAEEQQIFDDAIEHSHHGGPCCCKCWKWYMMSGLAKKLIRDHHWTATDIAELWDLSSSCGHDEDTNMHQHYDDSSDHQH